MKTVTMSTEFEARAADVLTALLGRVSSVELVELKRESQPDGRFAAILARIHVLGHNHTLVCELDSGTEPARLRQVLGELQAGAAPLAADAIPVVIAPYLSPEAQTLCKENKTGFLDFEGNARLTIGDFFLGTRAMPRQQPARVSAAQQKSAARCVVDPVFPSALRKNSPKQPAIALSA